MRDGALTLCAIGAADSVHVAARTRCFAERGHRVFLLTDQVGAPAIPGVTVIVVPTVPADSSPVLSQVLVRAPVVGRAFRRAYRAAALVTVLRRCRPDVVHVHFASSDLGWLVGVLGSRPLVVSVMGGDVLFDEQGNPTRTQKWLTAELLRQADYITSKSDFLISVLERVAGVATKSERVIWGIPLSEFRKRDVAALRRRLAIDPAWQVVLSPKILQRFYRVHLVVDAMRQVVDRVPGVVLLLTEYKADATYKAEIVAQIQRLRLDRNVRFCGHVQHAEMPLYYSLADATVAVPSSDGMPQTLLEGMACEVPNVLARLPRYEEIVEHRVSAYFVDADPASIASGILEILTDQELSSRVTRNALAIVQRTANLDDEAARVELRYRELTKHRPRAWSPLRLLCASVAYCRMLLRGS
jgi:glycosyltransferase involved in cell wall biosynthesis